MESYNKTEKRMMKNNREMLDIFNYINRLELENKKLKMNQCNNASDISNKKDIKEALKFAMLQAHPDNPNGSNEKFIKYKSLFSTSLFSLPTAAQKLSLTFKWAPLISLYQIKGGILLIKVSK